MLAKTFIPEQKKARSPLKLRARFFQQYLQAFLGKQKSLNPKAQQATKKKT
ncbi:MAG TPA: hypothetical protein PKC39_00145 [Ferruginibacter sp.]|nr:hypothetical protein [Ferruginibacter sp.]HMP19339.1 hypothetical protein [Ferruginibacter sp.]